MQRMSTLSLQVQSSPTGGEVAREDATASLPRDNDTEVCSKTWLGAKLLLLVCVCLLSQDPKPHNNVVTTAVS